jgi:fido (protein-threonine AMPylation protein)
VIIFEAVGTESHPVYQDLEVENGTRQYDFLRSIVKAALATGRPFLSNTILKAFNFQAIACLHVSAGEFRPCPVQVGDYLPPEHYRVPELMADFTNDVNRAWERTDPIQLAAYVLWKLNFIHPFINGNGRTARAACYYIICVSAGGWLAGSTILPELLRRNRPEYVDALKHADQSYLAGAVDLKPLHELIARLLAEQLASSGEGGGSTGSSSGGHVPPPPAPPALPPPESANTLDMPEN